MVIPHPTSSSRKGFTIDHLHMTYQSRSNSCKKKVFDLTKTIGFQIRNKALKKGAGSLLS
jgi:hypothetical protein